MDIINYIEIQYREIKDIINIEYIELYEYVSNAKLREVLSTLHYRFVNSFKTMNQRLPTDERGAHFWADASRELIETIEVTRGLQRTLKKSSYAFEIDKYYEELIAKCEDFLRNSGGSPIPANMEKVELFYIKPIFLNRDVIVASNGTDIKSYKLKLIGEGSYANVFKYKDTFYNKYFALKRAKKDLTFQELERFNREFEQMKALSSPYIVEVYDYNKEAGEYIMEYMDCSLEKYLEKNNEKLNWKQRKNIVNQVLRAFIYLESKGILHRDISPKNILIKEYEDIIVVKIADFGLVKIPESELTNIHTDIKGYFNDPNLVLEGFNNYNILHETYALTRLVYYIMTGRTRIQNIMNNSLKEFVAKGMNTDKNKRYKSISEVVEAIGQMNDK